MPLKKGKGSKVHSFNVQKMMDEWKTTGMMGTSRPKSMVAAMRQANAIAYSQAERTGKPTPKKRTKKK